MKIWVVWFVDETGRLFPKEIEAVTQADAMLEAERLKGHMRIVEVKAK